MTVRKRMVSMVGRLRVAFYALGDARRMAAQLARAISRLEGGG